jgi:PAS domain S-box-containing protein
MPLGALREGILSTDAEGIITNCDPGVERILGFARQEIIGQPLKNILRLKPQFQKNSKPSLVMIQSGLYTLPDKNGQALRLHITNASEMFEAIHPNGAVLLLRDLSEGEVETNLREVFLASISQEFRTPLAAINASVELLLEQLEELSLREIGGLLNSIHMSVFGLQMLIDNVLESMKIDAEHFKIHKRRSDLKDIVDEAVESISPLINRRGQVIEVDFDIPLRSVWIDSSRMKQALVNLLSNASKHNPIGCPISLAVSDEGSECFRVVVADRGCGISLHNEVEIFQRFARTEDCDEPQYGIGLGLFVVKAIVEAHGGEVGVDEREGGGSIFWFKVPYNRDDDT